MKNLFRQLVIVAFTCFVGIQLNAQCLECDTTIHSINLGYGNTSNPDLEFQTVIGNNSSTSRNNAVVIGTNSNANGSHSYVIGSSSNTSVTGTHAYVLGSYSSASASGAMAIGYYANSLTSLGLSLGHFLESQAGSAFVIGQGLDVSQPLVNHISNSLVIGFNSTKSTLFVGETPTGNQSGKVAIGNMLTPTAKLHIFADANEDASLKLDATGTGKYGIINFTTNHSIKAKNQDHLYFNTAQGKDYVFHQGDIYLDDIQSGIIMKSPNGLCWRGTLNDQGMLTFVQITCPDETPTNVQTSTESATLKLYPNPTSGKLIVETSFTGNQAELILCSTDGKILLHEAVYGNKTEINLNHLSSGIYVMQLVQNDKVIADEKVIVK
jgi:hypothetical protein